MANVITLDEIVELARQLSLLDKVRLIEKITPQIESELKAAQPAQRTTLRGLWEGINVTNEDLAEVRTEMWGAFPSKDI